MARHFIKKRGIFLDLHDFRIIERAFSEFEDTTDPEVSLSDSEQLVLNKVRRIIQNIEGALRYRENQNSKKEDQNGSNQQRTS